MRTSPNSRRFGLPTLAFLLATAGLAFASPEHVSAEPHADPHAAPAKPAPAPAKPASTPAKPVATSPATGNGAAAKPSATPSTTKTAAKPDAKADAKPDTKAAKPADDEPGPDAEKALAMLKEGNARWASNSPNNPNTSTGRRQTVADNGQKPFVTVLTCADSRMPVERMFDRGVGDVFVIRVAGNIAGDSETGTIEYGVGHLKTPLLVVMGHTKCGAVAAAASGAELHGKVAKLVGNINPAVERAKRANPSAQGAELAALAVKENVWQTIFDLYKASPEVREMVTAGKVKVVGAVADISTGKVEFMGEHPWQMELLASLSKEPGKDVTAQADEPKAGH